MGLGLSSIVLLILGAGLSSGPAAPKVEDRSILVVDLSLNILDSRPNTRTGGVIEVALFDDQPPSLSVKNALAAIERAAQDKRIVGLYLQGSALPSKTGYATLREVRRALEQFRATKKPIIAYDLDWTEREYYLASVAETIVISPFGGLEVNGFSSETTFFGSAFEKYGIGIQAVRAGQYKSAVEPFVQESLSSASRTQLEELLTDLWNEFRTTVSQRPSLTPEAIQTIANQGGFLLPEEAKERGWVDRIAYADEVLTDLKQRTKSKPDADTFTQVDLVDYAQGIERQPKKSKNVIALVYADGSIVDGEGDGATVGGDRLAEEFRRLRRDKSVKAIVLRINSPGGSATASGIIQREIALTQAQKPIIVSMGSLAASGGYWIAMGTHRVFAEPNTLTGSIGVFGLLPNVQGLANTNGITWDTVKTSRFADSLTFSRPKTPEELALQQKIVDDVYDNFLTLVAESRKLPKSRVAEIAQGRVWSGEDAQRLGLVDELGGLEQAIAAAAKTAKLGKNWHIEEYPPQKNLSEQLLKQLLGTHLETHLGASQPPPTPTPDFLTQQWQHLQTDLAPLTTLNDPKGLYARLPFTLRID